MLYGIILCVFKSYINVSFCLHFPAICITICCEINLCWFKWIPPSISQVVDFSILYLVSCWWTCKELSFFATTNHASRTFFTYFLMHIYGVISAHMLRSWLAMLWVWVHLPLTARAATYSYAQLCHLLPDGSSNWLYQFTLSTVGMRFWLSTSSPTLDFLDV